MRGAPTVGRYLQRIMRGETLKGTFVTYTPDRIEELAGKWGPVSHVKDAFTFRKYLVRVKFAQHQFVFSIKNTEAETPEEAFDTAAQRATLAMLEDAKPVGNLMGGEVVDDTPENRKKLGVHGEESRIQYEDGWRDAA